jgi:hypothetical protein
MAVTFKRIAVLGATGPTGRALASELARRKHTVRVVSRRADALRGHFPAPEFEKKSADALERGSLAAALQGCDLVIDCIGLPGERMGDHPVTARNIAWFVRDSGARCLQVSSYGRSCRSGNCPSRNAILAKAARRGRASDAKPKTFCATWALPSFISRISSARACIRARCSAP